MKEFSGKTAIVTGGASGVGKCLVEVFAKQGMNVVIADIQQDAIDLAVTELSGKGLKVVGIQADVTSLDSMANLADKAEQVFGNIHVLCNNAGIGLKESGRDFWEHTLNSWRWAFEVNSLGIVNGCQAILPKMLAHGEEGHVVNTSSGNGGLSSLPNSPIYAASKAAATSMSEVLHYQLDRMNSPIHAHVLFPGPHLVNTNLLDAARNRPEDLLDGDEGEGYKSFAELSEATGLAFDLTEPEEVAEFCFECMKKDQFWMIPESDKQDARIRERAQSMLSRTNPSPPEL
jgi:NAD(P)-dependent dehydrogenase (short-subunit alcohol dehydrogenase family)